MHLKEPWGFMEMDNRALQSHNKNRDTPPQWTNDKSHAGKQKQYSDYCIFLKVPTIAPRHSYRHVPSFLIRWFWMRDPFTDPMQILLFFYLNIKIIYV